MFNPNNPNHRKNPNGGGFTLAEMMISTVILLFLITTATAIATNFFNSLRNMQAANTVYDEANFTMERIIREIRNGTLDYEEYYNQSNNFFGAETNETYGQNYCQYSRQFYNAGPDGKWGTYDDESTGVRNTDSMDPIEKPILKKLYLIDTSGTRRTYVQRIEIQKMDSSDPPKPIGKPIGKVAILKLVGKDYGINHLDKGAKPECKDNGEGDGLIDTWVCDSGFKCSKKTVQSTLVVKGAPVDCSGTLETPFDSPGHLDDVNTASGADNSEKSSFVDITPETIDVVSLDFIITPSDDPRKAYNQADIQIQPNVTLKMVTRAAPQIASTFRGSTPTITLESTVSARAAKEVITECNLQECIAGMYKFCPKHTGILEGITQACSQGVWPGCSEQEYEDFSKSYVKNNLIASKIKGTGPNDSLTSKETSDIESDGLDHVGPFENSPRAFYETTGSEMGSCVKPGPNNSTIPDEECKRRRCSDGVDNDVNGKTDNEDPTCLYYLCNNGYPDPGEKCTDVGGPCEFIRPLVLTEANCTDNYDNDCNYDFDLGAEQNIELGQGADEYDQNCIDNVFCRNGDKDNAKFGPKDYDTPYYLFGKPDSNDLDEECVDIGGLCERTTDGLHKRTAKEYDPLSADPFVQDGRLCYDNLDNDCNYTPGDPKTGPDEFDASCKAEICGNGSYDCRLAPIPDSSELTSTFDFVDYLKRSEELCGLNVGCCAIPSTFNEACKDVGGLCRPEGESGPLPAETSNSTICIGNECQCFDGVDNDCGGGNPNGNGTDGIINIEVSLFSSNALPNSKMADSNCCLDGDVDGFAPLSATCKPAGAKDTNSQPTGFIDCNDTNNLIFPAAPEICGDSIDSNCSLANGIDNGTDNVEVSCCDDTGDGDGFGIEPANLPNAPNRCMGSTSITIDFSERTRYDCRQFDPTINPSIPENTKILCSDGANNSCRYAKKADDTLDLNLEKKDHIDMDATGADKAAAKIALLAAKAGETYNPDCCSTNLPILAEFYGANSAAAHHPGMEICDDTNSLLVNSLLGSDENCNGLEGFDDHYCIGSDENSFFDNLSSANYITNGTPPVTIADGRIQLPTAVPESDSPLVGDVSSKTLPLAPTCLRVAEVELSHTADLTAIPTSGISYEVSNDGGATWFQIFPSGPKVTFSGGAKDLRWKATLYRENPTIVNPIPDPSPTLNDVTLKWTCDL